VARSRQPGQHGASWTAQRRRRLLGRFALQVAEHDRVAELGWQPSHLLIQNGPEVGPALSRPFLRPGYVQQRLGHRPPPTRTTSHLQRHAVSDAIEPVAQRLTLVDRAGLARQDQERGLESVLGVLLVLEDAPAGP